MPSVATLDSSLGAGAAIDGAVIILRSSNLQFLIGCQNGPRSDFVSTFASLVSDNALNFGSLAHGVDPQVA
jgi:hypothetical protein